MKIALIAMVGIAAGLVGGGLVSITLTTDAAPALRASGPEADPARMEQLEAMIMRLEDRVLRLEVAPAMSAAPAAAPIPASPPEDADAAGLSATVADLPDAQLEEKILDVVAEREKAQREEMSKRRAEFEAARQAEQMNKLAELGLNSYQQEQLTEILARRRESMEKFRQSMSTREEGVDRGALRDEMRQVREQTNTEIQELLTADQYAAFREMDSDGRGRGGRGGGGRGR